MISAVTSVASVKKEMLIFLLIFFAMSLLSFWIMNGGAYAEHIRYRLLLVSPFARERLENVRIDDLNENRVGGPAGSVLPAPQSGEIAYRLVIPKISVEAPVVLPEKNTLESILGSLERGVGLYPGSANPGEKGRGVILGHSSRASWYRGDYAVIFALLSELEVGDEFYLIRGSEKYVYRVFDRHFVIPSVANEIMAGPSAESEMDLLTCWPVGSASKRTLIRAELVKA